jgi:hypothetical protein
MFYKCPFCYLIKTETEFLQHFNIECSEKISNTKYANIETLDKSLNTLGVLEKSLNPVF